MKKKDLNILLMPALVLVFFLTGFATFSQVQVDTLQNYNWNFEPSFKHPTQKEAYYGEQKIDLSNHKMARDFFKRFRSRFETWYEARDFEILATTILRSDVVFINRKSEFLFEIQYGNYQNSGFGLQTVGVYNHIQIDISRKKMLPEYWMSFTY